MKHNRLLPALLTLLVLAAFGGCDSSENPNLLNPEIGDSTLVRVVNLIPSEQIGLDLEGLSAAADLPSIERTAFQPFYFREPISVLLRTASGVDTLTEQQLPSSAGTRYRSTFFVVRGAQGATAVQTSTSDAIRSELETAGAARVTFVNAVPGRDFLLKQGCQSGDTLFGLTTAGTPGSTRDLPAGEYSFYLFENGAPAEEASGRITFAAGDVIHLIAGLDGSDPKLYLLDAFRSDAPGRLPETSPETRQEATIRVLNAADGTISVSLGGTNPIAPNLSPLAISAEADVQACSTPGGDSLTVDDGVGQTQIPIRMSVGARTLTAIYRLNGELRQISLPHPPAIIPDGIRLRSVNLTSNGGVAAVVIGAGAPAGVDAGLRPFGALAVGRATDYVSLPAGTYPLSLVRPGTGEFLAGGLKTLTPGYWTLLMLDSAGTTVIRLLRDDIANEALQGLDALGRRVQFFSLVPDALVGFEAPTSSGQLTISGVAYSYVYPTVLPPELITVSVPGVGETTLDLRSSGKTVGVTGTAGNRQIVVIDAPQTPDPARAQIRILNAASGAPPLDVHVGDSSGVVLGTTDFGIPTPPIPRDPARYSFTVTKAGTTEVVATIDGVELSAGRNYLLIVGPKGPTSSSFRPYGTLWMQE